MQTKKVRIGDLLLEKGLLSQEQLEQALNHQQNEGGKFGTVIVELGYLTEEKLLQTIANQIGIPFVDLRSFEFDSTLIHRLPEIYARRYRAIILQDLGNELLIGMVDPQDIFAFGEISQILKISVKPAIVQENALLRAIDKYYRQTEAISTYAAELSAEINANDYSLNKLQTELGESDAPVVKLLQSLFADAIQAHASDIHIEPDEKVLRIRLRIDGLLQEQVMKNRNIISALTQRLKLMARLDIAEKRLPQDGRFNIQVHDKKIDVRLSTMPVQYGESVVMRLLDQTAADHDLDDLGMPKEMIALFHKLIHRPSGMILVTGPTGSGKTTTLYSALRELNIADNKIITVEDPVEYRIPRVNQVQVNPKVELTFARVLRSALRQDPDIIMVGEIRDAETATIALRAAMTGHLVLATLHTNDARSSAMRLVDIGVEGYLVAVALRAILAQRLIRRICENCKATYEPNDREKNWLEAVMGKEAANIHFFYGTGCNHCNNTGYSGRIGVFELLELNSQMVDALRRNDTVAFNTAALNYNKSRLLGLSALDKAAEGTTTISEVMRIAEDLEDQPEIINKFQTAEKAQNLN